MSGVCPFALNRLIAAYSNDPPITPRVAILHVDAGNATSLYDYFAHRSGGIESHFHVQRDGGLEQYRDIYRQADANYRANDFAVSIETQGYGEGEWTAEQLATIKRLLSWLHDEAGIPLVKCPRWDGSGVGYHIQFGSPGYWTPVSKSCPGPDRIRQYHDVIVPWMAHGTTEITPEPAPEEEDEMKAEDWDKLREIVAQEVRQNAGRSVWNHALNPVGKGENISAEAMFAQTHMRADQARERAGRIWRNLPRRWKRGEPEGDAGERG